jgi:hypothetical protein
MLGSLAILSLAVLAAGQKVYSAKEDGLSQHTIFMPDTPGKIPVLVWSSGGCIRDGKLCGAFKILCRDRWADSAFQAVRNTLQH